MTDDFDDDLYTAYNTANENKISSTGDNLDTYDDEFADALDTAAVDMDHSDGQNGQDHPDNDDKQQQGYNRGQYNNQQRQYQQQQQQTVMMGGVPMPYSMALAYQQQMQQMMANPLQYQMMQQQFRQQQLQRQQQQFGQRQPFQQRQNTNQNNDAEQPSEGKLFVGGLNWDTTDESMKEYFSKFGPVASCMVMRDTMTGQSRGFGFLTMENVEDVDKVLEVEEHHLDGKKIDPKRAVPKTDQERCEKIFVGGISPEVNQDEFKEFFQKFGPIAEATLMVDRQTGRPRGFGFVTFEDAQSVDNALEAKDLVIKDRQVEIKRAMPKAKRNVMPNTRYAGAAMMMGRGGMFQQQANPYGNMAAMAAAYYGRMNNNNNNNRYQQQQDDIDSGRHHGGSSSTTSSSGGSRDRRHRDSSHDRYYRSSSSSRHRYEDRSGGGAVHASSSSSSRNQSSYRPY